VFCEEILIEMSPLRLDHPEKWGRLAFGQLFGIFGLLIALLVGLRRLRSRYYARSFYKY
jgi:hypothetical protein